jgi:uncharacterized protein (TIGR02270 family)
VIGTNPQDLSRLTMNHGPISAVVRQHAQDCANLRSVRARLLRAPDVKLRDLQRHDARLAAHLDGLAVAGSVGGSLCEQELERPGEGEVFAVAVAAIEANDVTRMDRLFALSAAIVPARRGMMSAFGWVSGACLRGTVKELLISPDGNRRSTGIAACAMHRVDPGILSSRGIADEHAGARARALRAAGEMGLRSLVSTCAAVTSDDDHECRFWAAWSAVLLGDRNRALEALARHALAPGPRRELAYQLALQAMSTSQAHGLLQSFATDPPNDRWLIRGAGVVGDPAYVPWLVRQMQQGRSARLAAEAFSLVTGADLNSLKMRRDSQQDFASGPNDEPADSNVEMDEDEGLPWPDVEKVQAWWHANMERFQAGTRYFMGQPLNRDNCLGVLKHGYQRQRVAAALYLSLLNPGTPLFEWRAPAWRQQRLLTGMA